jgi:RND family efflux transporter MFP subunit
MRLLNHPIQAVAATTVAALALLTLACSDHQAQRLDERPAPVRAHLRAVEQLDESRTIEVYGTVQPVRQAAVSSRVMGPVVAVHVQAGDLVTADAPLVDIQPEAIDGQLAQAQGALGQARAALALAQRNYDRYQALHAEDAASQLELDMASMQLEQARGAVHQAEGAVQAAGSVAREATVRAPFAARVVERLAEVGDMAAPGRPLVRLESRTGSRIWLTVREADIGLLEPGQELPIQLDARPDLGTLRGTVAEIVPSADPMTHSFTVKVDLPSSSGGHGPGIASGMSGRATIAGAPVDRLVIPDAAVHRRGGLELVVIRAADGTARTRAVTLGERIEPRGGSGEPLMVEVLSGLAEGEQVLVDAPGPVADGTPVEVVS